MSTARNTLASKEEFQWREVVRTVRNLRERVARITSEMAKQGKIFDIQKNNAKGQAFGGVDDYEAIRNTVDQAASVGGGLVWISPPKDSSAGGYGIDFLHAESITVPKNVLIVGCPSGCLRRIGNYDWNLGGSKRVFLADDIESTIFRDVYFQGDIQDVDFPSTGVATTFAANPTTIDLDDASQIAITATAAGQTPANPIELELQASEAGRHERFTFTGITGNTLTGVSGCQQGFTTAATIAWDYGNISGSGIVFNPASAQGHVASVLGCHFHNWGGVCIDIREYNFVNVLWNHIENALGGGIICRNTIQYAIAAFNRIHENYDDAIAFNSNDAEQAAAIRIIGNRVKKIESINAQGNEPCALRGPADVIVGLNNFEGGAQGCIDIRDSYDSTGTLGASVKRILIIGNHLKPNAYIIARAGEIPASAIRITDRKWAAGDATIKITGNMITNAEGGAFVMQTDVDDTGTGGATTVILLEFSNNMMQDVGGTAYPAISIKAGTIKKFKCDDNIGWRAGAQWIYVVGPASIAVASFSDNIFDEANFGVNATTDLMYMENVSYARIQNNSMLDTSGSARARYGINLASSCSHILRGGNMVPTAHFATGQVNDASTSPEVAV